MKYVVLYVVALVAANLSVAAFGPVVTPINAFMLIGLDLALRDKLHDRWQRGDDRLAYRMTLLVIGAAGISYVLNPASGHIALASTLAFMASNAVDAVVYHSMRDKGYILRSNTSNVAGAVVDSFLFPTIAFGALLPLVIFSQIICKVLGGFLWSVVLGARK